MIRLLDLDETSYIQQSKGIKKEHSMMMSNNEDTSMGRSLLSFFDKHVCKCSFTYNYFPRRTRSAPLFN